MSIRIRKLFGRRPGRRPRPLAACSSDSGGDSASAPAAAAAPAPRQTPVITLAAYSNVYDVYGKLISAFQTEWKDAHDGQQVIFQTSFGGSTTQAQNVVNGFPADIVALSLEPDVQLDPGRRTHHPRLDSRTPRAASWRRPSSCSTCGRATRSTSTNWNDLTQSGLQILTPDPAQSGGAKWNIVGRLRRVDARQGPRLRDEQPGRRAEAPHRHLQQRHGHGQERERLASRTSRPATATSRSPMSTRSWRRRPPGCRTRW